MRVDLGDGVLRLFAHRSLAYEPNVHIFILWMLGAALVLLSVAILFLRNQIRPILRLAGAAQDFGKGRDFDFRPHGAREVRQAGYAFIEMKRRVERALEQRTAMLNGVSHDLRTILTRFKLSLAVMDDHAEIEPLQKDVEEMQGMLEGYLAFARGDAGEATVATDLRDLLEELKGDAERHGAAVSVETSGALVLRCGRARSSAASPISSPTPSATPGGSRCRPRANTASSPSMSTTTARASRPNIARTCSGPSTGSTTRATRTRAAPASASPSRATSRARMAATSASARARWAACVRRCGCPCSARARETPGASPQGSVDEPDPRPDPNRLLRLRARHLRGRRRADGQPRVLLRRLPAGRPRDRGASQRRTVPRRRRGNADPGLSRRPVPLCGGRGLLVDYKLGAASPTRRVVASCCNSAMFLKYGPGFWTSAYRARFAGDPPPPDMRIQTAQRRADGPLPRDAPGYRGMPARLLARMLAARVAMLLGR